MSDALHKARAERRKAIAAAGALPPSTIAAATRVACAKLDDHDQRVIGDQVTRLTTALRGYQFGENMALELLAKLGWMLGPADLPAAPIDTPRA